MDGCMRGEDITTNNKQRGTMQKRCEMQSWMHITTMNGGEYGHIQREGREEREMFASSKSTSKILGRREPEGRCWEWVDG